MDGVEDRTIPIAQAVDIVIAAEAMFHVESVMLAHWYHENERPLARMVGGTLIPVGVNDVGAVVAFTGADFAYWTEQAATGANRTRGL